MCGLIIEFAGDGTAIASIEGFGYAVEGFAWYLDGSFSLRGLDADGGFGERSVAYTADSQQLTYADESGYASFGGTWTEFEVGDHLGSGYIPIEVTAEITGGPDIGLFRSTGGFTYDEAGQMTSTLVLYGTQTITFSANDDGGCMPWTSTNGGSGRYCF